MTLAKNIQDNNHGGEMEYKYGSSAHQLGWSKLLIPMVKLRQYGPSALQIGWSKLLYTSNHPKTQWLGLLDEKKIKD